MTEQSLTSFQLLVVVIEFLPPGRHLVVLLHLQVQRVMELFRVHCGPSQTIQRGSAGSHANRHRWGRMPGLSS